MVKNFKSRSNKINNRNNKFIYKMNENKLLYSLLFGCKLHYDYKIKKVDKKIF